MHARVFYFCAIGVFVMSSMAIGDILYSPWEDGDSYGEGGSWGGSPAGHQTFAHADGNDDYAWGWGEGGDFIYTTEYEYLWWIYSGEIETNKAEIWLWGGERAWAAAYAYIEAELPWMGAPDYTGGVAYVDDIGYYWHYEVDEAPDPPEPSYISDWGSRWFDPDTGVRVKHVSWAIASVDPGGGSTAEADSDVGIWGNLYFYE